MKERAVEQAKERLAAVAAALKTIEGASSLAAMRAAWHDLLTAAGTIYSKLEQGAKGSGTSSAWFGRKKAERKNDPLLRYVHHARNSAVHSIDEVAHASELSVSIRAGDLKPGEAFGFKRGPYGRLIPATTGDPSKLRVRGPNVHLVDVRDSGVVFELPKTHLGKEVSCDADDVGRHLLRYLEGMIKEAEGFVVPEVAP